MRRICVFILTAVLCLSICACSASGSKAKKFSQTEFILGTVVTLTVYDDDESSLDGAFRLCRDYENMLSSTVEGSDVWRINHAEGKSVTVSSETAELIRLSIEYSELTGGAFDITIAPLSALWNFSGDNPAVPSSESISSLLPLVDYKKISIDGNTVTVPSGVSIELGAIAKGYISDRLYEYFENADVSAALINLGGNIATAGAKPDGSQWQIGIRNPNGDYSNHIGTISCKNTSIVTSGIYERCFEQDGILYHHLLSSENGYPENNEIASVTIVCKNGADADALSTSLYLMGFEKGFEFACRSSDFDAVFILRNGEIHSTDGIVLN